jgi:hypothetical protein
MSRGGMGRYARLGLVKVTVIKRILLTRFAPIGQVPKLADFTNKMMPGSFRLSSLLIPIILIREG